MKLPFEMFVNREVESPREACTDNTGRDAAPERSGTFIFDYWSHNRHLISIFRTFRVAVIHCLSVSDEVEGMKYRRTQESTWESAYEVSHCIHLNEFGSESGEEHVICYQEALIFQQKKGIVGFQSIQALSVLRLQ